MNRCILTGGPFPTRTREDWEAPSPEVDMLDDLVDKISIKPGYLLPLVIRQLRHKQIHFTYCLILFVCIVLKPAEVARSLVPFLLQ